jgi:hypothetical protein
VKSSFKVIFVAAGYLVALVIAGVVVGIYAAATNGPDRQASSGMAAFGDSILFLSVFTVTAIPATGAALFFLRPYPWFWRIFVAGALAITTTGVAVFVDFLASENAAMGAFLGAWSMLSPLRILLAPLFAIVFFLCVLFAPTRSIRIAFFGAAAIETVVFITVAFIWFHPHW